MFDSNIFEELFDSSDAKFFSMIFDEVDWCAKVADPVVKNGGGDGEGFLVGQGNELDILCEGVCDAKDILLSCWGRFEGSKQIWCGPIDLALWVE